MTSSTDRTPVLVAPARAQGWLMGSLRRLRAALAPSRTLRPEDLSLHLRRDVGLLDTGLLDRPDLSRGFRACRR